MPGHERWCLSSVWDCLNGFAVEVFALDEFRAEAGGDWGPALRKWTAELQSPSKIEVRMQLRQWRLP